jgi:hypothetical protein
MFRPVDPSRAARADTITLGVMSTGMIERVTGYSMILTDANRKFDLRSRWDCRKKAFQLDIDVGDFAAYASIDDG